MQQACLSSIWMAQSSQLASTLMAARRDGGVSEFRIDAEAQRHIDAYVEYDRIVGNADGVPLVFLLTARHA